MKLLLFVIIALSHFQTFANELTLYDAGRDRHIPGKIYSAIDPTNCSVTSQCPVAFLSAGYGVAHDKYHFIAEQLTQLGYLTIAIGHELPSDPALSVTGNLFETRSENWSRGADTLVFVRQELMGQFPQYDFNQILLVGHSNGGDLSAWLVNGGADYVSGLITLDHRRVPLPRDKNIAVLSIRASDFPADEGVLPSKTEGQKYGICVEKIAKARHNDMTDHGPQWLKQSITRLLKRQLTLGVCPEQ